MAIIAPHNRHDHPVVRDDHGKTDGAFGDSHAGIAGVGGLSVAKVPGDPAAALANRTPPGKCQLDMFCRNAALGAPTRGMRGIVGHHHLRLPTKA